MVRGRAIIGVLLLSLAAALVGGCGLLSKGPAAVASLTLTNQVNEKTKEAVRPVQGYPAGTTQFFASVKVVSPQKGTKVAARWLFEGKLIDEWPLEFQTTGDRFVAFHLLSNGNQPFPNGSYRVEILLDGKQVQQQDFKVE